MRLEPDEGKLSRPVLRGLGRSNPARLPDRTKQGRCEETVMRYRIEAMSSLAGVLVWAALSLGLEVDAQSARPVGAGSEATFSKATYTYKRVGECDIKADVYRLPGKDVRPAVVWIHGGALIFGNRGSVRPDQLQRYLQAGFVLISIDYRLAPETKLPDIIEDLRDAYRWVREKGPELFWVNADRIALVGNSAGGYLALVLMTALCAVALWRRPVGAAAQSPGVLLRLWRHQGSMDDPTRSALPHVGAGH